MLTQTTKSDLAHTKNLLAFSAGGDSTTLLFLLLENNIAFDIAIVDYGVREQSKEEVAYAKKLANKYNLKCYVHTAKEIENNFEANARAIRYDFFEALIQEHHYETLLTAHHLGDRFEWMLMQFCKGAGCAELTGMKYKDKRNTYTLYRPLLHLDKQELLNYLNQKKLQYFEDKSNNDVTYKRNSFRHNYARPLLKKYLSGIKKSFTYLDEDVTSLIKECEIKSYHQLAYFHTSDSKRSNIYAIDKYLKSIGHIITANERLLLKENESIVVGRKYIVTNFQEYIVIAPYIVAEHMPKEFKEKMRILKIDPKLRGYLATDLDTVAFLSLLLQ
jgi:tRNA(Ile)-lysidine synthase